MCQSEECFVNLHLHTAFSLLDGMSKPEDVVKKVKSMNQKGFAVTEHGNVHSSVKAYKLAKENSLQFIYGCEFYICDNRFEKDKTKKYYHLTVLAKNEQGRLNINKLVSLGYLEGFYFKPRIDFDLLEQYSEGLIVMSGCMASELQQTLAGGKIGNGEIDITSGNIERAKEVAMRYRKVFGEDYYLEVQSHRDSRQQQLNRSIVNIAKDLGIEWVATADSHFVEEDDLDLHRIFIAINRNKDDYETDETYQDTHIQSEKEAWMLLTSLTEEERDVAIRNTSMILDKCNAHIPLSAPLIPEVKIPPQFKTQEEFLKFLCNQGWKMRKINRKDQNKIQEYKDRLFYEFDAITEMGFAGYYLLVYGYANSVKRRGIARGSGGGSLVAYLLNIVDIDPVEHGLYFERFIDVAQLDMLREGTITRQELKVPDFDLDFDTHGRNTVLQNIVEENGQERVAALGQFGYIWDKSAIKDVGRVLNIPFDITNEITKKLGDDTIKEGLENGVLKPYEKQFPKLFEYAQKLAGLPRSYGVHPCGKVVTIDEVMYYTAVSSKDGEIVIHLDMKDAEALGLVKVDLLGLRTINILYDTLDMIGKDVEYIRDLDYSDPKVLNEFRNGLTDGIFQMESSGMKSTLQKMIPSGLDDLSVVNALYRPGSMKFIDNYIARKHGTEKFEFLHPDLEEVLGVTYGIIVFQEQLISIGRIAGLKNADLLRQATGKKNPKLLAQVEPELREGLYKRDWSKEQVDELWEIMLDFAKYSFNKSHSQSYAIIAFICAFLKVYHPLEFMCAWLNSLVEAGQDKQEKMNTAFQEAKRLGIKFNEPDFRNAPAYCEVEDGKITYGLNLIKHCNVQMAEGLSEFRFRDYKYFIELLVDIKEYTSINSKQLNILINLGYFVEFGAVEELLKLNDIFNNSKIKYSKTHKEATKIKRLEALRQFESESLTDLTPRYPFEIISFEKDHYGFIKTTFKADKHIVAITDIDLKYTPKVSCYILHSGELFTFKVKKDKFYGKKDVEPFEVGDLIKVKKMSQRDKMRKVDPSEKNPSGWEKTGELDFYLESCSLISLDNSTGV